MGNSTSKKNLNLVLFFTWDVSLALWKEKGLLQREIRYYEELAHKGMNVTFLTWGDHRDIKVAKELNGINVIPLYQHIPCPSNKVLRAFTSLLAPWKMRDVLRSSDIIKTNQMWGGWCAVLSKLLFDKPLLVRTGYELYAFTIRQGHGFLRIALIWLISKVTYITADRIYLATNEDREFVIRKFNIPENKIDIRPNWIDTDFFRPLNVQEKENHILFVGRLTVQKNLPLLIEALTGTPWTLDIAGDGELQKPLEELAGRMGININFLGAVPNDVLPDLYNRYPVFVLPSLYEGNPKTLLEAMSCGRAVLGTNVQGINSLITNNETGIICEQTAGSLRQCLERLISDRNMRERLGKAARMQIEETQKLEKMVNKELIDYFSLART